MSQCAPTQRTIIRIVDWSTMQHYKHRNPPWVKLYADLLDRPEFRDLSNCDVGVYCKLLLLASKCANAIQFDPSWLRRRYLVNSNSVERLHRVGLIEIVEESEPSDDQPLSSTVASSAQAARLRGVASEEEERQKKNREEPKPEPSRPDRRAQEFLQLLSTSTRSCRATGDFESINVAVEELISTGACPSNDYSLIANCAGISESQARTSVQQLRERGRLQ